LCGGLTNDLFGAIVLISAAFVELVVLHIASVMGRLGSAIRYFRSVSSFTLGNGQIVTLCRNGHAGEYRQTG
jgi:hypothetical protein